MPVSRMWGGRSTRAPRLGGRLEGASGSSTRGPWTARILLVSCVALAVSAFGGRELVSHLRATVEEAANDDLPRLVSRLQAERFRLDLSIEEYANVATEAARKDVLRRAVKLSESATQLVSRLNADLPGEAPREAFDDLAMAADQVADAARMSREDMLQDPLPGAQAALRAIDTRVGQAAAMAFEARSVAVRGGFERLELAQATFTGALGALVVALLALAFVQARQNSRLTGLFLRSKDTEVRMQLALDAANAGWWFRDANDVITAPPETFELCGLGWSPVLTIAAWAQNVLVEDRPGLLGAVKKSREENSAIIRHKFRIQHPERGLRWMYLISRPILDAAGKQIGAHGLLTDDTDRILLEEELLEAKERADQAVAAKSRMLAAASHDLRQPLQSMFLFLSALEAETDPARRAEVARQLGLGMVALKSLLDSLVEVARLEGGAVEPRFEDIRLDLLLREAADIYAPRAKEKGLDLVLEAPPVMVRTDPAMLGRMVRNLVENAVRYTATGSIRIASSARDGMATVAVSDTGVGIPEAHLALVWEEFHQVGNAERDRGQGLGLGLAIVRSLSRLLGHKVTVASQQGEGSTFRVELPVSSVTWRPADREEMTPRMPEGAEIIPDAPLVVVDDDVLVLKALETMLLARGYRVIAAASGDSAAAAVSSAGTTPFMVVADYRLRNGETGVKAIAKVRRAAGADIPAMVLTGEVGEEAARDASENGIRLFEKPMPHRVLLAHVARAAAGVAPAVG